MVERLILSRYESVFATTSLKFRFQPDYSTSLCTTAFKNIIARYLHNGSPVLGYFLVAKAFNLVDYDILFETLTKRGLPLTIIIFCFLDIRHKVCMCIGNHFYLSQFVCLMALGREVSFLFFVCCAFGWLAT